MKNCIYLIALIFTLQACQNSVPTSSYNNPILAGFYPDPSICRVDNDYYLVNSTFSFFPGLPIFHSTDLVNWNQIGNAIDRREQLSLDSLGISEGLYAPTIRYHNGTYYLVCTRVGSIVNFVLGTTGNFVMTAKNPAGPWSNPVYMPHVGGIDPDIFFDEDGKAYITSCADPDSLLYGGHRTIRMHEFNLETLETSASSIPLVDGGTDLSKKPIWVEGPHLYKINKYYYLMCAQGGTDIDHSEVIFRSKNVAGPYESYAGNPILTQRNLDSNRPNAVTNTGHADLVQTQNGEWWSVFLGCRPYRENFFNTGRETFMLPVTWKNDWPIILEADKTVPFNPTAPNLEKSTKADIPLNGNFTLKDDFNYAKLPFYYLFIRVPKEAFYHVDTENEGITFNLLNAQLHEEQSPAFIGRRQQHTQFETSAALNFSPKNDKEQAGIAAFQNEKNYFLLAKKRIANKNYVCLIKSENRVPVVLAKQEVDDGLLYLKMECKNATYSFSYSLNNENWEGLADSLNAEYLSTNVSGGFVGTIVGVHASAEANTKTTATFNWFEYTGMDKIVNR